MYQLFYGEKFGVVVGVSWLRWFIGASLELGQPDVRHAVIRFGPFFMHIIVHD
jgi:hypothetical protein